MRQSRASIGLQLPPSSCLWGAMCLLLLPVEWVLAWAVAALFHELCHMGMILLCRRGVVSIRIGAFGAVIETEPMPRYQEFFCTLAGPLGGLVLVMLSRWMPRVAICAFVQTLYNLLPVYPLDGGRALRCVFCSRPKMEAVIKYMILSLIAAMGLAGTILLHLGPLPVVLAGIFLLRNVKSPCKQTQLRVQ